MNRLRKIVEILDRRRILIPQILFMALVLASCAEQADPAWPVSVTFPLRTAWHNGEQIYYITTDVSDRTIAEKMGANLSPRLSDGLPDYPKPPEQRTLIERVYDFSNSSQYKVFSSEPKPIGPASRDLNYSPVWLMVIVTWKADQHIETLKSEEEILAAAARGVVMLTQTDILLNCPIVANADGKTLPNVSLSHSSN